MGFKLDDVDKLQRMALYWKELDSRIGALRHATQYSLASNDSTNVRIAGYGWSAALIYEIRHDLVAILERKRDEVQAKLMLLGVDFSDEKKA